MKNKVVSLMFVFSILIAANSGTYQQSATFKQMNEAVQATQTAMPINDMYKVRNKVNQSQDRYKKAREAQAKQIQDYENLLK